MAARVEVVTEPIIAVDPETVESLIEQRKLGERIKKLRLRKSMGLVELGEKTGLSASFLSQLETGRVVPTIRNLARIAMVFNKDLSYFFHAEKEAMFRISKKKDRVRRPQGDGTDTTHIAESFGILVLDNTMRPCIAEFLPTGRSLGFRPSVFQGFEIVVALSGALAIQFGDRHEVLETGDAVYLDAGTPRLYASADNEISKAMVISLPRKDAQSNVPSPTYRRSLIENVAKRQPLNA
jgi:transcriptional regulator with XRE-family HTH domain